MYSSSPSSSSPSLESRSATPSTDPAPDSPSAMPKSLTMVAPAPSALTFVNSTTPSTKLEALETSPAIDDQPSVRRRRRAALSCQVCRARKQKCDRGHPCSKCVMLRLEHCCTYEKFARPESIPGVKFRRQAKSESAADGHGRAELTPQVSPSTVPRELNYQYEFSSARPTYRYGSTSSSVDSKQDGSPPSPTSHYHPSIPIPVTSMPCRTISMLRFKFSRINYFGPSTSLITGAGLDEVAPEAWSIFNYHTADNRREWEQMRARIKVADEASPSLVIENQIKAITTKLASHGSLADWDVALDFLPSRPLYDFLIDRFLVSANSLLYGTTAALLREDANYVWILRRHRPLSNSAEKIEIHKICLVLLCLRIARASLAHNWMPSSVTHDPKDDSAYLGPGIGTFAFAAIEITDTQMDANLTYIQLLYFLTMKLSSISVDNHVGHWFSPSTLNAQLASAVMSVGLHRDPANFPNEIPARHHNLWRTLWHNVVLSDSVRALEFGTPLLLNLKYSDTDIPDDLKFNTLETSEVTDNLGRQAVRICMDWSSLVRHVLDEALLCPRARLDPSFISQVDFTLLWHERRARAVFERLIEVVDASPVLGLTEEHQYTMSCLELCLMLRVRLSFLRAYSGTNWSDLVSCALQALEVQLKTLDRVDKMGRHGHFLMWEVLKVNRSAWMTVLMTIVTSIVGDDSRAGGPVTVPDDVAGMLRVIVALCQKMHAYDDKTYFAWRDNVSILFALKNVKSLAEVVGRSDLDPIWADLDKCGDLPMPYSAVWLDYFAKESSIADRAAAE